MDKPETIAENQRPVLPWEDFPCPGDSFAGYTLESVIGKGSFGTVFRVQPDPDVEWFEAVKILHRSSDVDKRRFHEEINRLKEIRLPGIARIHKAGEENGFLYYCMDYVEGKPVDDYITESGSQNLFPLFMELCEIVITLHEQNFIHLDIKPQNVMITVNNEVRLLDFGISCRQGEKENTADVTMGAGTYEFAPPEQISGAAPHPSMDVYSLSCLLFTLLCSAHPKIPFDKNKREKPWGKFIPDLTISREEVVRRCLRDEVVPAAQWNPLVSSQVNDCIAKGLAPSEERFQTVRAFRDCLIKAGAMLPSFIIVCEYDDRILNTVIAVTEELQLEFKNSLQIICVSANTKISEYDLLLTEADKEGGVKITSHTQQSDLSVILRRAIFSFLETEDQEAWETSPYKSLNSYSEDDAHLFYGRDKETGELCMEIDKLPKNEGLIAVLAPSGAGKSSFLKAGVIPYFKRSSTVNWQTLFLSPGHKGSAEIIREIRRLTGSSQQCLLIIDQFEDILGCDQFEELGSLLKNILTDSGLKVVLSLRNDFYKDYISFIEKFSLPDNFYNLPQPGESSIGKMIRMPALKAHLLFDKDPVSSRSLDEILKDDAMLDPESLAALSFTLDEVFNRSPRGHMSYEAYKKLGGMHGAMAKRAESVFQGLRFRTPNLTFHRVFHQLIKVDENKIPRRLYADYDKLAADGECKKLTDGFIEAKLFQVTRDPRSDNRIVAVAHEALIQQSAAGWQRIMSWQNRQQNNLLIRKRLAVSVNDWEEQGRHSRYLYSGYGRLKEILQLRKSGWSFTDAENEFISRSLGLVIRNFLLGAVSLAALLFISLSLWKESANVDLLTKERNKIQEDISRLNKEYEKQLSVLDELRQMEDWSEKRRLLMDDQLRLSNIASLQQNGVLPPISALTHLSEIRPEGRNWMWGRLLFNSLPGFQMLFGHTEEILSIDFSNDPQSKYIVTSSWDNKVILWDGRDGKLLQDLKYKPDGQKRDFEDARFSHDGFIAAANNDNHLYIWSIDEALEGKTAAAWKMPHDRIRKIFFSKNNKYMIVCGSSGSFSIWDWEKKNFKKPLAKAQHSKTKDDRLYSAALSPDGKSVITAGWDFKIKRWSWNGSKLGQAEVVGSHRQEIWWGEFSPNGKYYVSAGKDRVARMWDAKSFKLIREFGAFDQVEQHRGDVTCAVFSPDSRILATSSRDKKIRFWNVETGEFIESIHPHDNYIYCLDFSNSGDRLASSSADKLSNLYYFDKIGNQGLKSVRKLRHSDSVESFDVMGSKLVTASADGEIRLWSLIEGAMISHSTHRFTDQAVPVKALFLTQNKVVSADSNGTVAFWDVDKPGWQRLKVINNLHAGRLNELVLSKSRRFLAASFADGTVRVWSVENYELMFETKGKTAWGADPVIDFMSREDYLVCGDDEGKVFLFDWRENRVIDNWQPHERKIFKVFSHGSSDNEKIISCSRDGKVIMTDTQGLNLKIISHGVRGDAAYASISSDGRFLATSSTRDSNVFVWDMNNELELLPLTGHEEPINQVEFIGDDLILSASRDGNVTLWYSLSWDKLKEMLTKEEKGKSPLVQLQKAVWRYINGAN